MTQSDQEPITLQVEQFAELNPQLLPELFVHPAREALARHHQSPAAFALMHGSDVHQGHIAFELPDPRAGSSIDRRRIVEHGAILVAGLMLPHFEKMQITRVLRIGDRVDYFAGRSPDDDSAILEVGGTDKQSLTGLRTEKLGQARRSPHFKPPFAKTAFISVTRFAPDAGTLLEKVSPVYEGGK